MFASGHKAPARRQAGFSLLEVLVAFAILALSLGVLLQIFSRAMSTTAVSGSYSRAAAMAEARLAEVGVTIPLEEGDSTGDPDDGLSWALRIQQLDVGDIFPDQTPPGDPLPGHGDGLLGGARGRAAPEPGHAYAWARPWRTPVWAPAPPRRGPRR